MIKTPFIFILIYTENKVIIQCKYNEIIRKNVDVYYYKNP